MPSFQNRWGTRDWGEVIDDFGIQLASNRHMLESRHSVEWFERLHADDPGTASPLGTPTALRVDGRELASDSDDALLVDGELRLSALAQRQTIDVGPIRACRHKHWRGPDQGLKRMPSELRRMIIVNAAAMGRISLTRAFWHICEKMDKHLLSMTPRKDFWGGFPSDFQLWQIREQVAVREGAVYHPMYHVHDPA